MKIGIVAEDRSDVEVIDQIIRKYGVGQFSLLNFVGGGCGPIPYKCAKWAKNLSERGCTRLILVHDSDGRPAAQLLNLLSTALQNCPIHLRIVVIPVREIEAWLLADEAAIKRAMRLRKALKRVSNPESVLDPKKKIAHEVQRCSERRTTYLNTKHNETIARECSLGNLRRCHSFLPLDSFIQQHIV